MVSSNPLAQKHGTTVYIYIYTNIYIYTPFRSISRCPWYFWGVHAVGEHRYKPSNSSSITSLWNRNGTEKKPWLGNQMHGWKSDPGCGFCPVLPSIDQDETSDFQIPVSSRHYFCYVMFFLPTTLGSPDKEDMFEEDTTCFAQGSQAMEHMHKLLLQRSFIHGFAKVWCDDVMQNRGHDLCHFC